MKHAIAFDHEIELLLGSFRGALLEVELRPRNLRAETDIQTSGALKGVASWNAWLSELLIEEILKVRARSFESSGVRVGEIVRSDVQARGKSGESTSGGVEGDVAHGVVLSEAQGGAGLVAIH